MSGEEQWVDVNVVAKHMDVGKESVYRWINGRGFPAHRVGRLLRFRLSEVDEWVRASRSAMANDSQYVEEQAQ